MNYREWSQSYLLYYVQPASKARTYEQYSYLLQKHVVSYIGDKELCEITALDLQKVFSTLLISGNRRTGQGLAPSTVNTIITAVQGSFKAAVLAGEIKSDPSVSVKRPHVMPKQIESFSKEEQRRIEHYAMLSRPRMIGVVLCLYTGMRIGELLALEWDDVDFFKNVIHITKTCRDGSDGNTRIVDTPKTPKSRRTIPVPVSLMGLLHTARRMAQTKYVVSEYGKPITIRAYQRSFKRLLKRAGVPHKGFHALRHTFATRAAECGMDAKTIAEILGHKNPMVTLNLYVHSMEAHKTEMMNRVGSLLYPDIRDVRKK